MKHRAWALIIVAGAGIAFVAIAVAMGVNLWIAVAIAIIALVANGFLATLEDDVPGGFNNPDGTRTPKYVNTVAWVVRGVGAVALLLILVIFGIRALG